MVDELAATLRLMIAAGGPRYFDAREQWPLHRGLALLASRLDGLNLQHHHCLPRLSFTPDPDVGMRAAGVTRALWNLTATGELAVTHEHGRAQFEVDPAWLPTVRADLMKLDPALSQAFYLAATCWAAAAATSENISRSAESSPTSMRRSSDRNPRHVAESGRRQAAVTRK